MPITIVPLWPILRHQRRLMLRLATEEANARALTVEEEAMEPMGVAVTPVEEGTTTNRFGSGISGISASAASMEALGNQAAAVAASERPSTRLNLLRLI